MEPLVKEIQAVCAKLHKAVTEQDRHREAMLVNCRELTRASAYAIKHVHRRERQSSLRQLKKAQTYHDKLQKLKEAAPELYYSGTVHDAQKEFVEASVFYGLIFDRNLPAWRDLSVEPAAYLKGLGEVVGELRRYVLDKLREDGHSIDEETLELMETIHLELMRFDFPDALTYGLRRVTDQTRLLTEKTRGDITMAKIYAPRKAAEGGNR